MDGQIKITHSYDVKGEYDIIVAGGGVAGVAAAVSAARRKKRVLLVEKSNILGGLATLGLVNYWVPLCNGRGKQIIKGIAMEMLELSIKYGYDTVPPDWKYGEPEKPTNSRLVSCFSPEIFAITMTEWLKNEGVEFFFDCIASEPVMDGKTCSGLILESKSGREYYAAKFVIDATGDCDVLRRSGMPTVVGKNYFTYYAKELDLRSADAFADRGNVYNATRNRFAGGANLYGDNQPKEVPLYHGLTVEDVTDYIVTQQTLLLDKIKNEPRLSRDIVRLPMMPQLRTTCRIDGDYTLLETDKFKHFNDSVAAICDFDRRDYLYEVPYGTLKNSDYPNLITCGRSASGEGYGWDVLRIIPVACVTGQAAAEACVIAINDSVDINNVDMTKLQSVMTEDGNMIHFPDELIPDVGHDIGQKYYGEHF